MYTIKLMSVESMVIETFQVKGEKNAYKKAHDIIDLVKRGFFGLGIARILIRDNKQEVIYIKSIAA